MVSFSPCSLGPVWVIILFAFWLIFLVFLFEDKCLCVYVHNSSFRLLHKKLHNIPQFFFKESSINLQHVFNKIYQLYVYNLNFDKLIQLHSYQYNQGLDGFHQSNKECLHILLQPFLSPISMVSDTPSASFLSLYLLFLESHIVFVCVCMWLLSPGIILRMFNHSAPIIILSHFIAE